MRAGRTQEVKAECPCKPPQNKCRFYHHILPCEGGQADGSCFIVLVFGGIGDLERENRCPIALMKSDSSIVRGRRHTKIVMLLSPVIVPRINTTVTPTASIMSWNLSQVLQ